jgi:hypothetical protein
MQQYLFHALTLIVFICLPLKAWERFNELTLNSADSYLNFLVFENKPCIIYSQKGAITFQGDTGTQKFGMMCYQDKQWQKVFEYDPHDLSNIIGHIAFAKMNDSLLLVWTENIYSTLLNKYTSTVKAGWFKSGNFLAETEPVCNDTQKIQEVIAVNFHSEPEIVVINSISGRDQTDSLWITEFSGKEWKRSNKILLDSPIYYEWYSVADSSIFIFTYENESYNNNEEYDLSVYGYRLGENSLTKIYTDSSEAWGNNVDPCGFHQHSSDPIVLYCVEKEEDDSITMRIKSYNENDDKIVYEYLVSANSKPGSQVSSFGSSLYLLNGYFGTNNAFVIMKIQNSAALIVTDTLHIDSGGTGYQRALYFHSDSSFHYVIIVKTASNHGGGTVNVYMSPVNSELKIAGGKKYSKVRFKTNNKELMMPNIIGHHNGIKGGVSISGKKIPVKGKFASQLIITEMPNGR